MGLGGVSRVSVPATDDVGRGKRTTECQTAFLLVRIPLLLLYVCMSMRGDFQSARPLQTARPSQTLVIINLCVTIRATADQRREIENAVNTCCYCRPDVV